MKVSRDMSQNKASREASAKYVLWTIEHAVTPEQAKRLWVAHEERVRDNNKRVLAYAEDHSSYDEDDGLPEEEPAKQGNNKKMKQTVHAKLETVDLAEVFADADLTLLQGRRLCREYLSATRKARSKK